MTTPTALSRSGTPLESLFQIHGSDENDLSGAFALLLSRSPRFLTAVLADLTGIKATPLHTQIRFQTARVGEGITDVEVLVPNSAFIVFEAKKAAALPSVGQLRKYARRCRAVGLPSQLVSLTNLHDLPERIQTRKSSVGGIPIRIRSWRWVCETATRALRRERSLYARFLLGEFVRFLEAFMGLETMYSNYVFVVSLGSGAPTGWQTSWIEVVEKHRRYFYPLQARGWPPPPNYMGFRYHGRLQSIHHVESCEVVQDVRDHFPGAERGKDWGSHYLLHLGPPIRPAREVRAGPRVRFSARVWCMIDTLLTSRTISDALTLTERRERAAERTTRASLRAN